MAYLKTLLLLIIMIFFSATTYAADCIDRSRTEQGTGLIVEGDCVEPPILPYPEKYDCGTGMKLIQGTVDSCIAATETNDPGIWLPSCGSHQRLDQGTNSCIDMPNRVPVANAGEDQTIGNITTINLDGTASYDSDNDPLSYLWSVIAVPNGSTITLSDPTAVNPTFIADQDGYYLLQLIVNDGFSDSPGDTVLIYVTTYADVITPAIDKIGAYADDQNQPSPTVQDYIDAGVTGVDTDNLDEINNVIAGMSSSDLDTTEKIQAVVDDVNNNIPPVADAGADQNVHVSTIVQLDGSGSLDPNGDPLIYTWSFVSIPDGSNALLSDTAIEKPLFTADVNGSYVVRLVVNDGMIDSTPDEVIITASIPNALPVASPNLIDVNNSNDLVMLDGSDSTDADGDTLSYEWHFNSKPEGSNAVLSDPTAEKPTFTADVIGHYSLYLRVFDGREYSQSKQLVYSIYQVNTSRGLRHTINEAVVPRHVKIILADGVYKTTDLGYNDEIGTFEHTDRTNATSLIIIGSNPSNVIISGENTHRVFLILGNTKSFFTLENITVQDARAANCFGLTCAGGGLFVSSYKTNIYSSIIQNNYSDGTGGGMFISGQTTIESSIISGNVGGGISSNSIATIKNSEISNNQGEKAIYLHYGSSIYNSIIKENSTTSCVDASYGNAYIENTLIVNNSCEPISFTERQGSLTLVNSVIFDNNGVIDLLNDSSLLIVNSLIDGTNMQINGSSGSYISADYSYIDNNLINVTNNITNSIFTGNPGFIDANLGNYHLLSDSVLIDAGTNNYTEITIPTTDLEGNPRPVGVSTDIGAYEFQQTPEEISDAVLAQIGEEGDTGDATNSVVTVAQLGDIVGLTDVVAGNEAAYQDYIDANPDLFSNPATLAEVQAMIDTVNASEAAKASSNAVLSQIGLEADNPDSVNAIVTVAQLGAILPALTDINSTHETAYQDYIDANPDAFASPATPAEVQAMIDAVNIEQAVPIVGIKKTGEVNSYAIGDDGYYQKGEDRTYTSISTGIVLDNVTGLMWQTDGFASGYTGKSFNVAVSYCSNLTLGGYDNWRLPSINELQSIVHNIYGYDRVFGNGRLGKYSGLQGKHWSSTPALGLVDTMMVVTFFEYSGYYVDFVNYIGTTGVSSKNVSNNTLCVRNQ